MKHSCKRYLVYLFLSCTYFSCKSSKENANLFLSYEQPAKEWMEAVPLGNGRLGAMVYGGVPKETIALNEITMWSGQPDPEQERLCGKEKLAEIRRLFFAGKLEEGNNMATEYLSGRPHSFGSHLPVGNLTFVFHQDSSKVTNYRRTLDLEKAVANVSYRIGKITYKREYLCSNPDNILVFRFSADQRNAINMEVGADLLMDAAIKRSEKEIEFTGQALFPRQGPGGVHFEGRIKLAVRGGQIRQTGEKIGIDKADEVLVFVDVRTDFNNPDYKAVCQQTVDKAYEKPYDRIKTDHIKDYYNLFDRVALSLGKAGLESDLPTDVRWKRKREGTEDPGLDALFFQYGRYLLIAASRENSPLPANLQGLWNDNLANHMGWTCDYHLDINTQQNYWAANVANLPECNVPLFNYIGALSGYGEQTARKVYGSPGWVAHTVANVWGYTAPGQSVNWGLFPTAGAWLASHLWAHYEYTQDQGFLRKEVYPILKKTAAFLLDYMTMDPVNGYLMTGPSTSPENSFLYKGVELSLSMMPTCDRVLVYETLTSCIEASRLLGTDTVACRNWEEAIAQLPPIQIGKAGTIQEWFTDFELAHPNHRHSSHLLALYPFHQISLEKTPGLAKAAARSLYNQLHSDGWEDVEWSRANMINFYARLQKPEEAYESLSVLLRDFTRENLLTISPKGIAGAPYDLFIFDGNQAGAAGIAEMLLQSQEGYIECLPALPVEWKTGSFRGLCARGGGVVDLNWDESTVRQLRLLATHKNTFTLKLPPLNGSSYTFRKNGKRIRPEVHPGNFLTITLDEKEVLEIINQ